MMFEFASNAFRKMIKRAVRIYIHLRNMYRINIRSALFMIHPLRHGLANSRSYDRFICKVGESKKNVSSTLCAKRQRPLWGRGVLSVSRDFLGMLAHQAYCCVSEGWGPYNNCLQFLWQIGLGFCTARSKPVCIYGFGLPCKTDRRREFW